MNPSRVILLVFATLLTIRSASAQPAFQHLGDVPGLPFVGSQAFGVSPDGRAVVGAARSPNLSEDAYFTMAFRWTRSEGMRGLGGLPPPFNGGSLAYAASDDGELVVGASRFNDKQPLYSHRAFRWSIESGSTGLSAGYSSTARDVTPSGDAIVGAESLESGFTATRWSAGRPLSLGHLLSGDETIASAVSHDGAIIAGWSEHLAAGIYNHRPFRWSESTGLVDLGDFAGGYPPRYGRALALSADGSVVVGFGSGTRGTEAFRWTAESGLVPLGDLEGGTFYSTARAVSADGQIIVGESSTALVGTEAFIWDAAHGMRNLRSVLESDHGFNFTDWQLVRASGISADGLVIVGTALNPDRLYEAFVVNLRPCRADWNGDSVVNSVDFFEFIADFLAANADYNADGFFNSQDFFDFLFAFFAAC